ncbi:MAG: primase C-terminal domain-containing protein, partial [Miltoncostaeaceae bacterium]
MSVEAIPWQDGAPKIPTEVAQWIWNEAGKRRRTETRADGQPIPEGGRNNALASLAGSMRRR